LAGAGAPLRGGGGCCAFEHAENVGTALLTTAIATRSLLDHMSVGSVGVGL
jgi:hypothetical protein